MKRYNYSGFTQAGIPVEGELEATNKHIAAAIVEKKVGFNGVVVDVKQKFSWDDIKNFELTPAVLTKKEVFYITDQLQALLSSGLTLVDSLSLLNSMFKKRHLLNKTAAIKHSLETGLSFSQACAKHPDLYKEEHLVLLKAGEESGNLEQVLQQIYDLLQWEDMLNAKLKKATQYPMFILSFAFVVTLGIFIFVVPTFGKMFTDMGQNLPQLTQILQKISVFLVDNWLSMLMGLGLLYGACKFAFKVKQIKAVVDKALFYVPVIGSLIQEITATRFTRTFALLYGNGISIVQALLMIDTMLDNDYYQKEVKRFQRSIQEGAALSEQMMSSDIFPKLVGQMVLVGEKSGLLEDALKNISHYYSAQVNKSVDAFMQVLEPAIIMFVGLLIGCVVAGLFLPMFSLIGNVGS